MNLEHVAFNVQDAVVTVRWWSENLGLRVVSAGGPPTHMHFVADAKGSMLEIYSNPDVPLPDYPNMNAFNLHFAFSTDNMEAERDRLVAAGATTVTEITVTPAGDKLLFLRDPWGVPFQLVARRKPLI